MSGWLERDLPDSLIVSLVAHGVTLESAGRIKGAAEIYKHNRDAPDQLSQSEAKTDVEKIEKMVGDLRQRLRALPQATADVLITSAHLSRQPQVLDELRKSLDDFDHLLGFAWQSIEPRPGRPGSHRTWLANQIADAFVASGITVNFRPNGPYCQAIGAVFSAVGEPTLDVVAIARTALRERAKNLPTA